jgi:NO-binding membrane sensor protein with MHYT domain
MVNGALPANPDVFDDFGGDAILGLGSIGAMGFTGMAGFVDDVAPL